MTTGAPARLLRVPCVQSTTTITRDQMCGAPANTVGWHGMLRTPRAPARAWCLRPAAHAHARACAYLCARRADLGLIHSARFTNMTSRAKQRIYYVYGDASLGDFANETVFFVPPLPGDASLPTRLIMFGDLGRGSDDDASTWQEYGRQAKNTTVRILSDDIAPMLNGSATHMLHGVVHYGDISYATGYLSVWDSFLDMWGPVASAVPYITSVGNHESDAPGTASFYNGTDSGGECGVCATTLIPVPAAAAPNLASASRALRAAAPAARALAANTNTPWYSMNIGMVHLIMVSTEHDFLKGSAQYVWLKADLAAVNRSVTPWVIATLHRPMYIDSSFMGSWRSDQTVAELLRANLEDLFWQYRVNVAFYGHNHAV
ncbi:hypothetical protein EON67_07510, partial [archaeon]